MAFHAHTDDDLKAALKLWLEHGRNATEASRVANVPRSTFQARVDAARRQFGEDQYPEFVVKTPPPLVADAEEIRARRRREFERLERADEARQLIPVEVKIDGPIGILHFGDPHLDDPGTNLPLLEAHISLVKTTKGLFAGNVGDTTNNWPRRSALAYLHAEQSTTHAEAWALAEWFVREVPWLYILGGNHDLFTDGDPLQWITEQAGALYEPYGARLGLHFPNGRIVRINARHDFHGHSMWNTAHGAGKAAQMGWRDHILTCGHKHTTGYQIVKDPATGLISHALRVAGYKQIDNYAKAKGLPNQAFSSAAVTVIDPNKEDDDPAQVQVFWAPEVAADFLTFLRKRKAA